MSDRNEEIERYVFERFSTVHNVSDGCPLFGKDAKKECSGPDVYIDGAETFGIEITQMMGQDLGDVRKNNNAISNAQRGYRPKTSAMTEYSFSFDQGAGNFNINEIEKQIVEAVNRFESKPTGLIVGQEDLEGLPALSSVYRGETYEDCRWRNFTPSSPKFLDAADVKGVISDKSEKSKRYRPCDHLWLLIFINFIDPKQDIEIAGFDAGGIETGSFEKVFIYRMTRNEIIEINGASQRLP